MAQTRSCAQGTFLARFWPLPVELWQMRERSGLVSPGFVCFISALMLDQEGSARWVQCQRSRDPYFIRHMGTTDMNQSIRDPRHHEQGSIYKTSPKTDPFPGAGLCHHCLAALTSKLHSDSDQFTVILWKNIKYNSLDYKQDRIRKFTLIKKKNKRINAPHQK